MSAKAMAVATDVKGGDRIMPTANPWVSFGRVLSIEPLGNPGASFLVTVERTARSGSVRKETFGLPRRATVWTEVDA